MIRYSARPAWLALCQKNIRSGGGKNAEKHTTWEQFVHNRMYMGEIKSHYLDVNHFNKTYRIIDDISALDDCPKPRIIRDKISPFRCKSFQQNLQNTLLII